MYGRVMVGRVVKGWKSNGGCDGGEISEKWQNISIELMMEMLLLVVVVVVMWVVVVM